jgi:hypothetical protein
MPRGAGGAVATADAVAIAPEATPLPRGAGGAVATADADAAVAVAAAMVRGWGAQARSAWVCASVASQSTPLARTRRAEAGGGNGCVRWEAAEHASNEDASCGERLVVGEEGSASEGEEVGLQRLGILDVPGRRGCCCWSCRATPRSPSLSSPLPPSRPPP